MLRHLAPDVIVRPMSNVEQLIPTDFSQAVPDTIKYYLDRTARLIQLVSDEDDPGGLFAISLAPGMISTGLHFAVSIGFAARALCPPAGIQAPEVPQDISCTSLLEFHSSVSKLIAPIGTENLHLPVSHRAGEADLLQNPVEYVSLFALPNMIFHFSSGYAGLRQGGMNIGKADFDGFHFYS